MLRLIDGDALMTELSTMYKEPTSTEDFMTIGYDKAIADVVVTAHRQPTVDAVEVIRCRGCKHYQFADERAFGMPVKRCEITGFEDVDDFDFCSRGERRTDA